MLYNSHHYPSTELHHSKMKLSVHCKIPPHSPGSCLSFSCQDVILHPKIILATTVQQRCSWELQSGSEVEEGRGCAPRPVPFAHPEVPGVHPSASCTSWTRAWTRGSGWGSGCSSRRQVRAGAPQFTTAELAMMFTPQAPDPRCK